MTIVITNIIFQTTAEQQIEEQRIRFKKVKSKILTMENDDEDDDGQSRQTFECWSFLMSLHSVDTNFFYQIASIAATRVESMRDLLIRYFRKMIVMIMNTITMITMMNIITTRWEEMSISGEKDTMDFQPLTQFLKCYAIYFAS